MTTDLEGLNLARKRAAAKRARDRQAAREKAARAEKRAVYGFFLLSLEGLPRLDREERVREYKAEIRAREQMAKDREREAREYWSQERKRQKEQDRLDAERGRWGKMVERGIWDSMDASEKRQWLERCRDVNPILYRAVQESGVT